MTFWIKLKRLGKKEIYFPRFEAAVAGVFSLAFLFQSIFGIWVLAPGFMSRHHDLAYLLAYLVVAVLFFVSVSLAFHCLRCASMEQKYENDSLSEKTMFYARTIYFDQVDSYYIATGPKGFPLYDVLNVRSKDGNISAFYFDRKSYGSSFRARMEERGVKKMEFWEWFRSAL